jgi:hypothetical protein
VWLARLRFSTRCRRAMSRSFGSTNFWSTRIRDGP